MKLNKRVLASVALSVSLVGAAVTPAAWAAERHLNCAQNFQDGIDADINLVVAKHLRRNCNLSVDQISTLNVEDMKQVARELKKDDAPLYSEEELKSLSPLYVVKLAKDIDTPAGDNSNGPADGEQQSGPPLLVNEVKAGDRVVTGSVYLLPGQQKVIQVYLPGRIGLAKSLKLEQKSGEEGNPSKGEVVTFSFDVPEYIQLKDGDEIEVIPFYNSLGEGTSNDVAIKIIVKPNESGNDQDPGGGADDNVPKPPVPDDNQNLPKLPAPGDGAGEDGSNLGNIFGVIAGLAGLAALVASVAKIFNHGLGMLRILQPLRDFLAQFNIKF
ncbi:intracellular motility protein A [Corynebacterium accolens]|uniref:intracellular motility protein A n=1 Tax=Corynebacterium accolens TaxID=38284 RepID=UPI002543ED4A|nr:intracellular motility protein A [Corynebacterium accolens]MDK4279454.1 intracellular motility protein A [Corynebacterium accolens]